MLTRGACHVVAAAVLLDAFAAVWTALATMAVQPANGFARRRTRAARVCIVATLETVHALTLRTRNRSIAHNFSFNNAN